MFSRHTCGTDKPQQRRWQLRPSCVWNISPCVTTAPWECHTHHLLIRCFFILRRWIPSSQWPEKGAVSFQLWKHSNACLTLLAPAVMRDLPLMLPPPFWPKATSYTHLNHFCVFLTPAWLKQLHLSTDCWGFLSVNLVQETHSKPVNQPVKL